MDPILVWAMGLGLLSVLLFIIEVMLPSGGLLGIASTAALGGTITCLFLYDTTYGWVGLVVSLILIPVAIVVALKVFPHTPVGKHLILADEQKAGVTQYTSDGSDLTDGLEGARGVSLTDLRPIGVCVFDGRRVECLAENGMIDGKTPVEVVSVDGMEVKVRPAT